MSSSSELTAKTDSSLMSEARSPASYEEPQKTQSSPVQHRAYGSFAAAIFISALLVFQVQPMVARYLLPWFGGSPSVWTTCMLFFQMGLLLGYAYAHSIVRYLTIPWQVRAHGTLLLLSLLWLPIAPTQETSLVDPTQSPQAAIFLILFKSIGLPYILLAATGPLLQSWFAERFTNRSPYRLYALSNVGSLVGLLIYPFVIEPLFTLGSQTFLWGVGYGIAILSCGYGGWSLYQHHQQQPKTRLTPVVAAPKVSLLDRCIDPILWVLLAGCGSALLLAATNYISQDVAVVPFVWILPLCLYLLTFTIAFDNPRWYARWFWLPVLLLLIPPLFGILGDAYKFHAPDVLKKTVLALTTMFVATMICHGELTRSKPSTKNLTLYYLMIALGGACGGIFVSIVAPKVNSDYWEWPLAFVTTLGLVILCFLRSPGFGAPVPAKSNYSLGSQQKFIIMLLGITMVILCVDVSTFQREFKDQVLIHRRNFYGVLRVVEEGLNTSRHRYELLSGNIDHGSQLKRKGREMMATTYYSTYSGVGLALNHHPRRKQNLPLKVGVVGLGVGTLASYLENEDHMTFYEINPDVVEIAHRAFTYLPHKKGQVEVVLGDARLTLAEEAKSKGSRNFDVLVIDAFQGDAVPIHLLTSEAFKLYFQHLKSDGILAIHISNKTFNLAPLTYHTALAFSHQAYLVKNGKKRFQGIRKATWTLITNNLDFIKQEDVKSAVGTWPKNIDNRPVVWTDEYSNVLQLIDF